MATRNIKDCDIRLQKVWEQASAIWLVRHPDLTPFITCAYRSGKEQDALYAQGRTKRGRIVTNARAGQSAHNCKPAAAFDMAFKNPDGSVNWDADHYKEFAEIVTEIDPTIVAGAFWRSFKDLPHYETPDWRV